MNNASGSPAPEIGIASDAKPISRCAGGRPPTAGAARLNQDCDAGIVAMASPFGPEGDAERARITERGGDQPVVEHAERLVIVVVEQVAGPDREISLAVIQPHADPQIDEIVAGHEPV